MNRLFTASAVVALLALSTSSAFAACAVRYEPRSIDRPQPDFVGVADANGHVWADNESLSPNTGGYEIVANGVYDVTDPSKPHLIYNVSQSNGNTIDNRDGSTCGAM